MLARLRAARYACARGIRGLLEAPGVPFVCVLALGVCATLLVWVALAWINTGQIVDRWGARVPITAFVRADARADEVELLATQMRDLPEVERVEVTGPEGSWERLATSFGDDEVLLRDVSVDAMPSIIDIHLREDVDPSYGAALVTKLDSHPRVEDVVAAESWAREVESAIATLRTVVIGVGIVVVAAGLLIVGCTIRLSVLTRRHELRVLRLLGATPSFVRASFWLAGAVEGGLAVGLSLALSWWGFVWLRTPLESGLSWMLSGSLRFFTMAECAAGVLAGALVGIIGSHLATARDIED